MKAIGTTYFIGTTIATPDGREWRKETDDVWQFTLWRIATERPMPEPVIVEHCKITDTEMALNLAAMIHDGDPYLVGRAIVDRVDDHGVSVVCTVVIMIAVVATACVIIGLTEGHPRTAIAGLVALAIEAIIVLASRRR